MAGVSTLEDLPPETVHPRSARFQRTCKSFCPGLYCRTTVAGDNGEQPQEQEHQLLAASQKDGRCAPEQVAGGVGVEKDLMGISQRGSTDTRAAVLGPAGEDGAEEEGKNFAAGDDPVFRLPLKVSEVRRSNYKKTSATPMPGFLNKLTHSDRECRRGAIWYKRAITCKLNCKREEGSRVSHP